MKYFQNADDSPKKLKNISPMTDPERYAVPSSLLLESRSYYCTPH